EDVNEICLTVLSCLNVRNLSALSYAFALADRWEGEEPIGNDTAMARLLIAHGAEVRLSHAALLEDTALVETLLKSGVDVNEDPPEGYSAMGKAVERNLLDIVRLLLDYGYNE